MARSGSEATQLELGGRAVLDRIILEDKQQSAVPRLQKIIPAGLVDNLHPSQRTGGRGWGMRPSSSQLPAVPHYLCIHVALRRGQCIQLTEAYRKG